MPVAETRSHKQPESQGERTTSRSGAELGGATLAAELTKNVAAATDKFSEGMIAFGSKAQWDTRPDKLKGFLFEYIEAAKFNRNAARAGSSARAEVMGSMTGGGHALADIKLTGSGAKKLVQLKVSENPRWLADEAIKPKYDGMDVLVPRDKVDEVNRILAEKGTRRKVIGELQSGQVASGGTKLSQVKWAASSPKLYRLAMEAKQVGIEAVATGAHAAAAGAVIGGAQSTISNVGAYLAGKTDVRTAATNVAKDAAASSVRAGGAGALSAVVRNLGPRAGLHSLSKSNIATAVASGLIEVGGTVYSFAKGEIPVEEAAERIGETGCATASGIYFGAGAGAIFGPVGAVVGSIAGYMVTSWAYRSSLAVLQRARLAEEDAARVVALCAEAAWAMEQQRETFEVRMDAWLNRREDAFRTCFVQIDKALVDGETDAAVTELARLTAMTGKAIRFRDFNDFEQFMTQSRDPLVI